MAIFFRSEAFCFHAAALSINYSVHDLTSGKRKIWVTLTSSVAYFVQYTHRHVFLTPVSIPYRPPLPINPTTCGRDSKRENITYCRRQILPRTTCSLASVCYHGHSTSKTSPHRQNFENHFLQFGKMGHSLERAGIALETPLKCLSEKKPCVSGLLFLLQVPEIDHGATLMRKPVGWVSHVIEKKCPRRTESIIGTPVPTGLGRHTLYQGRREF